LYEQKDKLERLVRVKSCFFDGLNVQNNSPKDRFSLYLEKKEQLNLERKIEKVKNNLQKIKKLLIKNCGKTC